MRYTSKTANAYLNRYGLRVEQNKAVAATLTNGQVIGWWNVYGIRENGSEYRLLTNSTLGGAMEQAKWHLLEGRPQTAIALNENSCGLEALNTTIEPEVVTKGKDDEVRTLNQVNAHYEGTGYSLNRNVRGCVEVWFEGAHIWTIARGRTVSQVVDIMLDMPWLERGVNSCALPTVDTIETISDEFSGVGIRFTNGSPTHVIIAGTVATFDGHQDSLVCHLVDFYPEVLVETWWASEGADAFNSVEQRQADVLVYDCTGITLEGAVYRIIEQRPSNLPMFNAHDMTVNFVSAACALPTMNLEYGWHHGWCSWTGLNCLLSERTDCSLESGATRPYLDLGYCFQYDINGKVTVFCPDGSTFSQPYLTVALEAIDLGFYNVGQHCLVEFHYSPINEFGAQEVVVCQPLLPPPIRGTSVKSLEAMGYPSEECWVDSDGSVYTLDGEDYLGHITERYQPPAPSYLSESEYYRDSHLLEF